MKARRRASTTATQLIPLALCLLLPFQVSSLSASPVLPEDAQSGFRVDDGLSVTLVAAEPLIGSPVAMAWDDKERLFVVENRGYPVGMPDGSNGGVVAMLEDTDGDGRMDRRTVFAGGFTFPNGILAWDGGFFVTCAPDLFFLKDTNDDGRADIRQVVLTGFDTRSSTQLRVAHPTFGPDGWIYLTSGLARAADITSPLHSERPPVRIGTDSRFDPFTHEIEAVDGRGQFGQTFDDWGNRFHCMNRVHIQHTVLPSRFLKRNPAFTFTETVQNVPEGMVDDLLKSRNVAARIYPISDNLTTADSHAGTFSAACGVHVYRGDNLPEDYYGDVFTCDPTGNLVHRDRLVPVGPTFSSRMVNEGREFLASPDNWFRPVYLATGPDGALYVADMYRGTIEHPDYLPEEVRKRTDFDAGRNRGRIWRVTSATAHEQRGNDQSKEAAGSVPEAKQALADAAESAASKWVAHLDHSNVWQRERAMKYLVAGRATNALPHLWRRLPGRESRNDNEFVRTANREAALPRHDPAAAGRVNALNTLFAIGGWNGRRSRSNQTTATLSAESRQQIRSRLLAATVDPSPGVRLNAWRHLRDIPSPGPEIADEIVRIWSNDPNPAVRFQVALALGSWQGGYTTKGLIHIALQDGADKWTRAAFLSGIDKEDETAIFEAVLRAPDRTPAPELAFELGRYAGRRQREALLGPGTPEIRLCDWIDPNAGWFVAMLGGIIEGVGLRELLAAQPPGLRRLGCEPAREAELIQRARALLHADENVVAQSAIAVLALTDDGRNVLLNWIQPHSPPELRRHALQLLADSGQSDTVISLTSPPRWKTLDPTSRALLIDGLLQRTPTADLLFGAIAEDRVQASDLSLAQRDRLKARVSDRSKQQAEQLFATVGGDRMRVYEQIKGASALPGNAARGLELFRQHCAGCHRLEREGYNVGPDLFAIRNQPREAILLHVLVPNHEVYPGFAAVTLETRDDRSLTGIIRSETETSITIIMAQGITELVARDDVVSLQTSPVSLMPDGFEELMNRQQLADLLTFLKGEASGE